MDDSKTKIVCTFDSRTGTWNAMSKDMLCLFYGTADELDAWIENHKDEYEEIERF